MTREFDVLFNQWAATYDETVVGNDLEYQDVFLYYEEILEEVASRSVGNVLEFGIGTGNLTRKLIDKGHYVVGIEPSSEMRIKAAEKLPTNVEIFDGDFIHFPLPEHPISTIASSYAFHHLTDDEKKSAISIYASLLDKGGKIVFADTMFETIDAHKEMISHALKKGFYRLANDLQSEYYTTHDVLREMLLEHDFVVRFMQMNDFVWVMDAIKIR